MALVDFLMWLVWITAIVVVCVPVFFVGLFLIVKTITFAIVYTRLQAKKQFQTEQRKTRLINGD